MKGWIGIVMMHEPKGHKHKVNICDLWFGIEIDYIFRCFSTAWEAANLAEGTLKGEQDT